MELLRTTKGGGVEAKAWSGGHMDTLLSIDSHPPASGPSLAEIGIVVARMALSSTAKMRSVDGYYGTSAVYKV